MTLGAEKEFGAHYGAFRGKKRRMCTTQVKSSIQILFLQQSGLTAEESKQV